MYRKVSYGEGGALQLKLLRRVFKIRWQQHVPNTRVLEMAETGQISYKVKQRQLRHLVLLTPFRRNDVKKMYYNFMHNRIQSEQSMWENGINMYVILWNLTMYCGKQSTTLVIYVLW